MLYYYTILYYNTTLLYYYTIQLYDTILLYFNTILYYYKTIQYYHNILLCYTILSRILEYNWKHIFKTKGGLLDQAHSNILLKYLYENLK